MYRYQYVSASNCVVNSMIRPLLACHAIVISRVFSIVSYARVCSASNEAADATVIS